MQIAQQLLGKVLVSNINGKICRGIIVETEAYKAPEDKACHAHLNRFTKRTETMFREGGCAYIYLVYGIHNLLNIVTGHKGMAHAVLIRALEPVEGLEIMIARRAKPQKRYQVSNGPGSLTKAMGISKSLNGTTILSKREPIWIEDAASLARDHIVSTTRIGIDYAEEWKDIPWRFYIKDNKWVSKK